MHQTIQKVVFPPEIDFVGVKSVYSHGKEIARLSKSVKETLKDVLGNEGEGEIVAWSHDEKGSTLDEAYVMLLEDESVVCYNTTSMPNEMSQLL